MDKNGFLIDLSESEQTAFGRIDFSSQTVEQKTFSAIWELESQVNNGGFDQYFRNSEADIIAYAPTALREIGARLCAAIVESAIKLISPIPDDFEARCDALNTALEDDEDLLEDLDGKFYEYHDDVTALLFAFVAKYPHEFGAAPIL